MRDDQIIQQWYRPLPNFLYIFRWRLRGNMARDIVSQRYDEISLFIRYLLFFLIDDLLFKGVTSGIPP
jgi:hypothetical protein